MKPVPEYVFPLEGVAIIRTRAGLINRTNSTLDSGAGAGAVAVGAGSALIGDRQVLPLRVVGPSGLAVAGVVGQHRKSVAGTLFQAANGVHRPAIVLGLYVNINELPLASFPCGSLWLSGSRSSG